MHVTAKDFLFTLDTSRVRAGSITFAFRNDGPSAHNFASTGPSGFQTTPTIAAGQETSFVADLTRGQYTYFCTVPGHGQLGMHGTFSVT